MSNEEIIEYCRKLIQANLSQYVDTNIDVFKEYIELSFTSNKEIILKHCIGIKALLEKCIELLKEDDGDHIPRID